MQTVMDIMEGKNMEKKVESTLAQHVEVLYKYYTVLPNSILTFFPCMFCVAHMYMLSIMLTAHVVETACTHQGSN